MPRIILLTTTTYCILVSFFWILTLLGQGFLLRLEQHDLPFFVNPSEMVHSEVWGSPLYAVL